MCCCRVRGFKMRQLKIRSQLLLTSEQLTQSCTGRTSCSDLYRKCLQLAFLLQPYRYWSDVCTIRQWQSFSVRICKLSLLLCIVLHLANLLRTLEKVRMLITCLGYTKRRKQWSSLCGCCKPRKWVCILWTAHKEPLHVLSSKYCFYCRLFWMALTPR